MSATPGPPPEFAEDRESFRRGELGPDELERLLGRVRGVTVDERPSWRRRLQQLPYRVQVSLAGVVMLGVVALGLRGP